MTDTESPATEPDLISQDEAARRAGVSKRTVGYWLTKEYLTRHWVPGELAAWVDANELSSRPAGGFGRRPRRNANGADGGR